MDLFVSASHEEGFSNSILEAMASGLPIVATSVGGTVEQIEHEGTGLLVPLVPPQDSSALAGAFHEILSNDTLAANLGAAARRRTVEAFSIQQMAAAMSRLYEELVACP
jgi:glycosyltransferase involved in cell wall biosynthesis